MSNYSYYITNEIWRCKQIKFTHNNSSYTGKAMGIDAEGNLEIKLRNGKKKFLHSGEVQIQK